MKLVEWCCIILGGTLWRHDSGHFDEEFRRFWRWGTRSYHPSCVSCVLHEKDTRKMTKGYLSFSEIPYVFTKGLRWVKLTICSHRLDLLRVQTKGCLFATTHPWCGTIPSRIGFKVGLPQNQAKGIRWHSPWLAKPLFMWWSLPVLLAEAPDLMGQSSIFDDNISTLMVCFGIHEWSWMDHLDHGESHIYYYFGQIPINFHRKCHKSSMNHP